jgi:TrmH family RNA methyltransferase
MQNQSPLDNISIVLVETRTPANIGSIARCMMNMGLNRLVLVNPLKPPDENTFRLAAGADEIINRAVVATSLSEAVADRNLVIGASRHTGKRRTNIRNPREMAGDIVSLLFQNRAAIVFGNEVNGLDNEALALCHELVAIPSSGAFPSLNLAHAVMIIAYELFSASLEKHSSSTRELARSEELENYYHHLQETLKTIEFLDRDHPERIMISLRQLFSRARLDSREIRILRGALTAIKAKCNK